MADDHDPLPLTRSLQAEVLSAFAVPERAEGLDTPSLITALETTHTTDTSLTQGLARAGYMQASAHDQAVIDWIDAVFEQWTRVYPLPRELNDCLQSTRAMAAAFALEDSRFFVPGGHVLHRLLDLVHSGLTGWHRDLGEAGNAAFDSAKDALQGAWRDFPSESRVEEALDLLKQQVKAHCATLAGLDTALLARETEAMGVDLSSLSTALALNDILAEHLVPGSVARFIKSDWYESGVLTMTRHGEDSGEWRNFINTTQLLVDAVQPVKLNDMRGQERLQNTMQQLPGTLSRQLLSLQPDTDAIAGAIGLIEYALLRNMRGEDLGLLEAEPIAVSGLPQGIPPTDQELIDVGIVTGSWYAIDSADGELHLRLAGTLGANIYLVFMDFLGGRALRKSSADFSALLRSGEARSLTIPDSFCRAMVEATEKREQAHVLRDTQAAHTARDLESGLPHGSLGAYEPDRPQQARSPRKSYDNAYALEPTQKARHDSDLPATDQPYDSNTVVKLQIPTGTWIGFHDRDPPLMARVAVRDLEKDSYIFTNREGIKLRELTVTQLMALIDRDMVDILERKTNFRETIKQMRSEQERLTNL